MALTFGGAGLGRRTAGNFSHTRRSILLRGAATAAAALAPRGARAARVLRLGHGLPPSHPVHQAMLNFAEIVAYRTQDELTVQIYAEGLLGEEPALIEQTKAGGLDLTKASASVLGGLDPRFRVFDVPFLLRDKRHWQRVVTGSIGSDLLNTGLAPVLGLTFYNAGARSFYGRTSMLHPDDLRGLTIRVQPAPSTVRMVELLEATPRLLPWNLVYAALQTRLVDAAENNPTALTLGRHAEVVRYFSLTEHTMVPDVLLVSRHTWDSLSGRHQSILRGAAQESALLQEVLWEQAEAESRSTAQRMGIIFQGPDREAFTRKLASLRKEFGTMDPLGDLIARVEQA